MVSESQDTHYWSTCDRDDKGPQGRLMNVSPIHRVFSRQLSIVTAVLRRFVPPNFLWRATRYLHQIGLAILEKSLTYHR